MLGFLVLGFRCKQDMLASPCPRYAAERMSSPAGAPTRIDGKYEVLREVSRRGPVTVSEVRAAEGVTRRVAWFDVTTPATRQAFHAYRAALRAIHPAGLTDVVARPGAFYSVWQDVGGVTLDAFLAQHTRQEEAVESLRSLAGRLAEHGYALDDAEVVLEGREARVAYLGALDTPRSPEEVAARNEQTLAPLSGGRVRRRRQPGAWLTFVPGLLLLGGAVYLGAQAAQTYLNPPVREVVSVGGLEAKAAAQKLTAQGFRVEYTEGQAGGRAIGTIIRQEPPAGTNLPLGRLVTLTVNNPPSIEVPRLEEMNLNQARDALKDRAMALGKVVKVDGTLTRTPEGRIVAQLPEAGAAAQRGQLVQVMVSTGIGGQLTWIGPLAGLSVEQAKQHARAAGLVVTEVREQPSDKEEGTVLEQSPAQYVRVEVGSPVVLTVAVARYSAPSRPADRLPLPPAYVPPTPDPPEAPQEEAPPAGAEPAPAEETPAVPDAQPEPTPAPTPIEDIPVTPPSTPPAEIPAEPTDDGSRTVAFEYTFPADLPDGSYSVVVQDADGERVVLAETPAADVRGRLASDPNQRVTGDAVFIIRRDGVDFDTVTP